MQTKLSLGLLLGAFAVACGGAAEKKSIVPEHQRATGQRHEDQSRCEIQGRDDRDVADSSSPNSLTPNIRRVYGTTRIGEEVRRSMLCREVDTNLDGVKDLVRTYNDKGESLHEAADSDYDGKIDTWITFANSRINRLEVDHNADGNPDETRFYVGGKLIRLQRDNNFDGKPDQFEVYREGRLERIGRDVNFDGQVDHWERDELRDAEAGKAEAKPNDAKAPPSSDTPPAGSQSGGTSGKGQTPSVAP